MNSSSKEEQFLAAITALKATAKEQGNCLDTEQVEEFLQRLELDDGQKALIYEYLKTNKIGIDNPLEDSEMLSTEEYDYMQDYLQELSEIEEVTDGEKRAIIMSAMAQDTDAKQKLIQIYLQKVLEIAKLYVGQGVELADLVGEGNVELTLGVEMIGAMEKPDEIEGMLGKMIMDAMEQLIDENSGEKKLDQKVLKLTNKIQKASQKLAEELMRKVTIEEVAENTGCSIESIQNAIRISGRKMEYIEGAEDVNS